MRDVGKCFEAQPTNLDFTIIKNKYIEHINYNPGELINNKFKIITLLDNDIVKHHVLCGDSRRQYFICQDIPTYELARFIANSFNDSKFESI